MLNFAETLFLSSQGEILEVLEADLFFFPRVRQDCVLQHGAFVMIHQCEVAGIYKPHRENCARNDHRSTIVPSEAYVKVD